MRALHAYHQTASGCLPCRHCSGEGHAKLLRERTLQLLLGPSHHPSSLTSVWPALVLLLRLTLLLEQLFPGLPLLCVRRRPLREHGTPDLLLARPGGVWRVWVAGLRRGTWCGIGGEEWRLLLFPLLVGGLLLLLMLLGLLLVLLRLPVVVVVALMRLLLCFWQVLRPCVAVTAVFLVK